MALLLATYLLDSCLPQDLMGREALHCFIDLVDDNPDEATRNFGARILLNLKSHPANTTRLYRCVVAQPCQKSM